MGVIVDGVEVKSSIPASRVFKALVDSNNLVPKIMPHVKSIKFIEGNGGAGSIKLISVQDGGVLKSMKERVEKVEETNRVYNITIIESESVGVDFESINSENKVEGGGDGGSIVKSTITFTFTTKGENRTHIQQEIAKYKHSTSALLQAIQSYLQSNPNEYN